MDTPADQSLWNENIIFFLNKKLATQFPEPLVWTFEGITFDFTIDMCTGVAK